MPTDALENAPWRSGSVSTFTHELANKRPNVAVLCRLEDAALKFRGCFQAICELRREHRQRERERVVERVVCGRQGVVVLEPTYTALRPTILSLFLILLTRVRPSSFLLPPFLCLSLFIPLRTSPHFLSHFHCLVTVRPLARPPFVCSAYEAQKRTVTLLMSF